MNLMDKKTKTKCAEAVRRQFTAGLKDYSFYRTKTTLWTRLKPERIEFIHLHLFSFSPSFRVHLGVRVLNDTFKGIALNGLYSCDGWYVNKKWYGSKRKYTFEFDNDPASIQACSSDLVLFCSQVAIPYFEKFKEIESLITDPHSPLDDRSKISLKLAIRGQSDHKYIEMSKKLLGVD